MKPKPQRADDNQFGPDQIIEMNQGLLDSAITLYLSKDYDRRLLPIKAHHLRGWWEEDSKTRMHARFCLPLTMASGLGFYILSPATFTVEWDGNDRHDAEVTIVEACSHAKIDNHSSFGSFTVQSSFIARTKNLGDFVCIKGVANQTRLPYTVMEAMIESWWSPSEFGIVCLVNQPGKFTIKKGEPLAQMFVLNSKQGEYKLGSIDGYPPIWDEWILKQDTTEKNLDYFRGQLPDGTQVCPHFKSWSEAAHLNEIDSDLAVDDFIDAGFEAEKIENFEEALRQYNHATHLAEARNDVSERLIETLRSYALKMLGLHKYELSMKLLLTCVNLNDRYFKSDLESTADLYGNLAYAYRMLEDFDAAARHYENSLRRKRAEKTKPLDLAETLLELGTLYDYSGKHDQGEALLKECEEIFARELSEDHPKRVYLRNSIAILYTNQERFEEARQIYDDVLRVRTGQYGAESPEVADTYIDIAFHYKARKDFKKAEEYFKKSMEMRSHLSGADDLSVADGAEHLSWIYRDIGQQEEAVAILKDALRIRLSKLPAHDPIVRSTYRLLGETYTELGEQELATQALRNA